jgi:hypothetical protein
VAWVEPRVVGQHVEQARRNVIDQRHEGLRRCRFPTPPGNRVSHQRSRRAVLRSSTGVLEVRPQPCDVLEQTRRRSALQRLGLWRPRHTRPFIFDNAHD